MNLESDYIIHGIGPKIRELRKEMGIRLAELAEASNLSTPMISKIENGRVVPTIPSLFNILKALNIEPEIFFAEINDKRAFSDFIHLKADDYKTYVKEESAKGFLYQSIIEKTLEEGAFQISHVTLEPGNTRPKVSTEAFEFLYIIKGEIDYYIEEQHLLLSAGESLFFDGRIPHVPINRTEKEAEYLVIYFFSQEE